jgi:hypothetical protein
MTGLPTALGGAVVGKRARVGRYAALAMLAGIAVFASACDSTTVVTTVSDAVASLTITADHGGVTGGPAGGGPISMEVGDSVALSATATNALGLAVWGVAVTWSSSAPSVVQVGADGVADALSAGEADVYAATEGASASIHIVVSDTTTVPPAP